MQAALMAECKTAKVVIDTPPSTQAGLRALEGHLREDDSRLALHFIRRTVTYDEGRRTATVGDGIDWLISKWAAEIAEAA